MSSNSTEGIKSDPFVAGLLKKIPKETRHTFTEEQLLSLKIALGARQFGNHQIDIRGIIRSWRWRYYYVFLAGKERRPLTQRQQRIVRVAELLFIMVFLAVSTLLGLFVIYIAKSALGIDLIPGHSLGIWGWFKG